MVLGPNILRQLDAFSLRTKRAVLGLRQGAHRSQRRGHGVEFSEYRTYELGDNPRYIDWSLYARSDKLYIKRYLEEENVCLFIVLDGSPSLTHPELRSKWECALTLATLASYIALASQDPVVLSVLGGETTAKFWGGRAFHAIQAFGARITEALPAAPKQIDLVVEATRSAARMKFPGICLYISDFLYPLEQTAKILSTLRSRNVEVHAVQILGSSDVAPATEDDAGTFIDSELGTTATVHLDTQSQAHYSQLLADHNRQLRDYCLSHQVQLTSTVVTGSPLDGAVQTLPRMSLFL